MALRAQQFTVSTTAVELRPTGAPASAGYKGGDVWITAAAAQDLYLGPTSAVTTSTGFMVPKGTTVKIHLNPTESIFGIAGGSGTVYVLRQDF